MLKRYDLIAQAKKQRVIPDLVYQKNVLNLPDAFTLDKKIYHRIDKDTVNVLYNLTYTNMHLLYEQSTWKWNEKKELADLRSNASRFLMIHHQSDNTIAGFLFFKLLIDSDDFSSIFYIFSIMVRREYQKMGLGKCLMSIAEDLARNWSISKCQLTVFKHNAPAFHLYTQDFQYEIDPFSPSKFGMDISCLMELCSLTNNLVMKF